MIQPFTKADVARMSHLQPDGWQNIVTLFQFYVEADFCLPLKIEDNNRIVAIGSLIRRFRVYTALVSCHTYIVASDLTG